MGAESDVEELDLVLRDKDELAQGVVGLTFATPDGADLPAWTPGAHIDLVITDELTRQYSLCGSPGERAAFRIAVLRESTGRGGSLHVHDELAVGDKIHIRGPSNHFALVDAERYVFIAGGIGITPLLPMIGHVAAGGRPWQLIYGGRTRSSMAFASDLVSAYPGNVEIQPFDEVGLLDLAAILAEPGLSAKDVVVYCCGPEPLITAVEAGCQAWPHGALHTERFAPKVGAEDGLRTSFEVELVRSGIVLPVPEEKSILDVLEEAGIQVLSSCQEGTCGTCETAVCGGIPDHRDSVLTDDEQAQNDTMMICVSRSCSPRLTLDL